MTDTKRTISISEARKRIFEIADEVQVPNKVYTLTADGKPKAIIMSAEEYESIIETMEVERIFPDLDKDIAEVKKAIKTGQYKSWSTLEDLEKKYGISTSRNKKSGKSTR